MSWWSVSWWVGELVVSGRWVGGWWLVIGSLSVVGGFVIRPMKIVLPIMRMATHLIYWETYRRYQIPRNMLRGRQSDEGKP